VVGTKRKNFVLCAWRWSLIHSFFHCTRFVVLLYCSETSRFQSLQSDVTRLPLSCSLFSECPAVTLRMFISSLFLVLQTVLDRGALKHIYKGQEIAAFRWRDIKCWAWIHVWTGLLGICHRLCYLAEFFPSLIKYKT